MKLGFCLEAFLPPEALLKLSTLSLKLLVISENNVVSVICYEKVIENNHTVLKLQLFQKVREIYLFYEYVNGFWAVTLMFSHKATNLKLMKVMVILLFDQRSFIIFFFIDFTLMWVFKKVLHFYFIQTLNTIFIKKYYRRHCLQIYVKVWRKNLETWKKKNKIK